MSPMHSYISMVFVNVAWGLSFIASKHALNVGFSPMTLAFLRYVITATVLIPAVLIKEKGLRLQKRDIIPMFLSGLLGITLYYFFEYQGIQRTTTVNASLILASIPILTLVVDAAAMKTKLRMRQVLGAILSLIGVYCVVRFGTDTGSTSFLGDLLIVGASFVWVGYIFVSRKLRDRYSSLAMNAWQTVFALFTLLPLALSEKSEWQPVSWDGWASAAGLALICSALCYFLYGNALKQLSPVAISIFINLIPLVTILGGVAFLNETITVLQVAGGLIIVASILLVNLPGGRKAPQPSAMEK